MQTQKQNHGHTDTVTLEVLYRFESLALRMCLLGSFKNGSKSYTMYWIGTKFNMSVDFCRDRNIILGQVHRVNGEGHNIDGTIRV